VISLFSSSPKKSDAIELNDEDNRARIEAAIERAIEIPEVAIGDEMKAFFAHEKVSEKPAVDPWDVVKEFMREDASEHAA